MVVWRRDWPATGEALVLSSNIVDYKMSKANSLGPDSSLQLVAWQLLASHNACMGTSCHRSHPLSDMSTRPGSINVLRTCACVPCVQALEHGNKFSRFVNVAGDFGGDTGMPPQEKGAKALSGKLEETAEVFFPNTPAGRAGRAGPGPRRAG